MNPTGQRRQYVFYDPIPASPDVDGLPVYACDMFTRTGQASIRGLQKVIPVLKEFSVKQIGLALFYLDGGRTDRTLTSERLEDFRQQGEIVDAESAGLCLPSYLGIRECLADNMALFNDLRRKRLRENLEGKE
jgi:hypothetical protein